MDYRLRHAVKNQTWIVEFIHLDNRKVQINAYYLDVVGAYNPVKKGQTYCTLGCNEYNLVTQLFICENNKSEAYDVVNPMKREQYGRPSLSYLSELS